MKRVRQPQEVKCEKLPQLIFDNMLLLKCPPLFLHTHTVECVRVCVCMLGGGGSGFNLQTWAVCVPALWACVRYLCHQLCFSELSSLPSSVSLASWTKRPTLHPMQITSPLHPMHITAQCLQRCSSLNRSRRRFDARCRLACNKICNNPYSILFIFVFMKWLFPYFLFPPSTTFIEQCELNKLSCHVHYVTSLLLVGIFDNMEYLTLDLLFLAVFSVKAWHQLGGCFFMQR